MPAVLMKVPVVPVPVVLWTEVGPPVPGAPGLARQTGANPKKGSRGKYTYYGFASYLVICRQQVLRGRLAGALKAKNVWQCSFINRM